MNYAVLEVHMRKEISLRVKVRKVRVVIGRERSDGKV